MTVIRLTNNITVGCTTSTYLHLFSCHQTLKLAISSQSGLVGRVPKFRRLYLSLYLMWASPHGPP